ERDGRGDEDDGAGDVEAATRGLSGDLLRGRGLRGCGHERNLPGRSRDAARSLQARSAMRARKVQRQKGAITSSPAPRGPMEGSTSARGAPVPVGARVTRK